jgi:ArsR family transcriptional regulator, arsenate/arsenite/antimonite-responsive transcriptional repressor
VVADEAFDALADPVRREILTLLSQRDECSAGELSEQISRVGRTAVSSHLRVLRTAGLIAERRTGRFRYYSVDPTGPAQEVIQLLIELFQGSLDATKAAAENTAASTDQVGIARSAAATAPRSGPVAGAAHPDGSVRRAM